MRMHLNSIVFLKKQNKTKHTHNANLIMRKTSEKLQYRHILQNAWPVLQTVKVILNKESLRNYHSQEESQEDMTMKCNVISSMGSWNRKKASGKN